MMKVFASCQREIEFRYGTRRACARHFGFLALHKFGWFHNLEQIDWLRVNRLIFVCQGNICRSPYAESRARAQGLNVTSFGLEADGRSSPDPTARKVAQQRSIVLDGMISRPAQQCELRAGDLILAMEPTHAQQLESIIARAAAAPQLTLLGLWKKPPRPYIPDPYGRRAEFFENCFDSIDEAINSVAHRLVKSTAKERRP